MSNLTSPIVVVVDDDDSVRRSMDRLLRSSGLRSRSFASAEALLRALDGLRPSCAIVDVHLPGLDGLGLQRALHERHPGLPVFVITADDAPETRRLALAAGAAGFWLKPFPVLELLSVIQAVLGGAPLP
jgi:FixJ family two-component response regulator